MPRIPRRKRKEKEEEEEEEEETRQALIVRMQEERGESCAWHALLFALLLHGGYVSSDLQNMAAKS